jgi:hypothetical protein
MVKGNFNLGLYVLLIVMFLVTIASVTAVYNNVCGDYRCREDFLDNTDSYKTEGTRGINVLGVWRVEDGRNDYSTTFNTRTRGTCFENEGSPSVGFDHCSSGINDCSTLHECYLWGAGSGHDDEQRESTTTPTCSPT